MIMTSENLSPLEQRIIATLEESRDEWLSRSQIAERIGRTNGYTQNDVRALKTLLERGRIEVRETVIGVAKSMYEYRAKQ